MITLRRAQQRHHVESAKPQAWLTFYPPTRVDPLANCFGKQLSLRETWLAPKAESAGELDQTGEVLTYVREGRLTHQDRAGESVVIQAGEFHLNRSHADGRRREFNASKTDSVRMYQLCVRGATAATTTPSPAQQERFSAAQRRGQFCLIASSDARRGSLRIGHEARIYSALLDPGQHAVYEVPAGHCAWLHVVDGFVTMGDLVLNAGDGVGVSGEPVLSVTPREHSELLLVDILDATAQCRPPTSLFKHRPNPDEVSKWRMIKNVSGSTSKRR